MVIKVIIRDYFTNLLPYLIAINTLYVFFGKVSPMFREFLSEVPVPTAGLALGIVALGKLIGSTLPTSEIICASISALLITLVTLKAIVCRKQLAVDLHQSVQAAVFGTFFMTYMQLSTYIANISLLAAQFVWAAAVCGQFALMIWFTKERILEFKLGDVFATWFVCYVGIIVGSVTSPILHLAFIGQGLFWFGFIAYIILLFLVTARHAKLSLTAGAAPTFCIYAAPMSLSLAGYLAVYSNPNIVFVAVLEVLAQVLFVVVLTQLPKFLRAGFFPSYAAMTFPFVITATALQGVIQTLTSASISLPFACTVLFYAETVFALGMTAFVLFCFIRFFFQKIVALSESKASETKPCLN